MTQPQKMINAMHSGSVNDIVVGITSESPILLINAIMAGTKKKLHDDVFIKGVKSAENSNDVLMGYPIRKVATASLHLLGERKYTGNDKMITAMIDSKFDL